MGGEYPKGGGRYSWGIRPSGGGAIFLGYLSPRGRYSLEYRPLLRGGESPGGGKSPVTTAWVNSSTFLICPPPRFFL